MMQSKSLGALLLIVGTAIGATTLALPLVVEELGWIGCISAFLIAALIMKSSAYMLVDVASYFPEETRLASMARKTIGPYAQYVVSFLLLLLLYSLMTTYVVGFVESIHYFYPDQSTVFLSGILMLSAVVVLILGVDYLDAINRLLVFGFILLFMILVAVMTGHVQLEHLVQAAPIKILDNFSVILSAFGFHVVIPSVYHLVEGDVKKCHSAIKKSIIIIFLLYLSWIILMMGSIDSSTVAGNNKLSGLMMALKLKTGSSSIVFIVESFCLFALLSSFLGILLSLFDALKDLGRINNVHLHRNFWIALTVMPPLLFVWVDPYETFKSVLSVAGIFVALLNVGVPALMSVSIQDGPITLRKNAQHLFLLLVMALVVLSFLF